MQSDWILTCDLGCSFDNLAEMGVVTEGDKFDAGVTGSEVHLFQENAALILVRIGLRRDVLGSESKRELLSPSGTGPFFLKLKHRKKPPDDELPLDES